MEKKYLLGAGIVAIVLIIGIFAVSSIPNETRPLKIGYTPIAAQLPLFAAVENGYFEEVGLDYKLVLFEAPNQVNDALMQGQIDVTCPAMALGIFAMADYKNPGKIKIYDIAGGTYEMPVAKVLVPIDSEIQSFSELKGKKFGIWGGTIQWTTIANNYLDYHGLKAMEDIEIVELAPSIQVQALASKQVDALLALEPMATVAIEQGAGKVLDPSPTETTINNPAWIGAGAINVAYANSNPTIIEKYIQVINKGIEFVENNPNEARKYMPKYTPITEELSVKVPMLKYKSCEDISNEDLQGMQNFFDLFTKFGVVDGEITSDALLYCK